MVFAFNFITSTNVTARAGSLARIVMVSKGNKLPEFHKKEILLIFSFYGKHQDEFAEFSRTWPLPSSNT